MSGPHCDREEHIAMEPLAHLVEHLRWGCTGQAQQVWLLEAYRDQVAHELAEKIRQEIQSLKDHEVLEPDKDWAASTAADFIDPSVPDEY